MREKTFDDVLRGLAAKIQQLESQLIENLITADPSRHDRIAGEIRGLRNARAVIERGIAGLRIAEEAA